jgi:2-polyprenyl-3-methyl-5-hydroxy-6-metoxy-1,4-benzoquinol methylase
MLNETISEMATQTSKGGKCPSCRGTSLESFLEAPDRFHGRTDMYRLVQCQSCALIWLDPAPAPEEMGHHYGPDYDRSVAQANAGSMKRESFRRNFLTTHKQRGTVLDLGCSSGSFLNSLKGPDWILYGIEMSPNIAKIATERTGANIFVGDVLEAPFAPNTFDAITCFHVLEHMYYPREILAKISGWLKPGGVFVSFMPNIDSAGARIFGSYWYALELPRHLYHFSPKSLRILAQSVGLEEVSVITDREVFIEASTRYILDDTLRKIGINRAPLARAKRPGIPFRLVRKAFRMTALPLLNSLASFAGDGESIHAVFRKGLSI